MAALANALDELPIIGMFESDDVSHFDFQSVRGVVGSQGERFPVPQAGQASEAHRLGRGNTPHIGAASQCAGCCSTSDSAHYPLA